MNPAPPTTPLTYRLDQEHPRHPSKLSILFPRTCPLPARTSRSAGSRTAETREGSSLPRSALPSAQSSQAHPFIAQQENSRHGHGHARSSQVAQGTDLSVDQPPVGQKLREIWSNLPSAGQVMAPGRWERSQSHFAPHPVSLAAFC